LHSGLEAQAQCIETLLASHRIPSQVLGGTVTPRWIRFQVVTRLGVRLSQVSGLSEELALSLAAPSCRVVRENGALHIEIPRPEPASVSLLDLHRRLDDSLPGCAPVLGIDEGGTPLLLNLSSPDVAHVLVCGTTGSGKTALARSMALSLALNNSQRLLQLLLIDPKGRGFSCLADVPHLLTRPLGNLADAVKQLAGLVDEMERRDVNGISSPKVVVFIDEFADLLLTGGRELVAIMARLSQRGREAGIHLVACIQKPTTAVMGSLVRANFPARLVGSVTCPEEARLAAGLAGTGAERLQGHGDFILVLKGQCTRFSAAFVSVADAQRAVRDLDPAPRALVRMPCTADTARAADRSSG